MNKPSSNWVYLAAIAACIGGVLWYSADDIGPLLRELTGRQTAPAEKDIVAPVRSGPRYPVEPPAPQSATDNSSNERLPPLAESDSYFRGILINIFGDSLDSMLVSDELVTKFVATVDGLSAAKPSRKPWPIKLSLTEFQAVATDDVTRGEFYLSPENYTRFDYLVTIATSPAPATVAGAYRHMYPLFQEAYAGMGYPEGYFNDRLVDVIDQLLQTPQPAEPILLVRPRVYYEFADPKLEALSGGQKLLIRMGSKNGAKIRQMLQALRVLIGVRP